MLSSFYKKRKRDEKIKITEIETKSKKMLSVAIVEDEYKSINAKQYLTLIEAALLLNEYQLYYDGGLLVDKFLLQRFERSGCLISY